MPRRPNRPILDGGLVETGNEIDVLVVGEGERSGGAITIRMGELLSPQLKQFVIVSDDCWRARREDVPGSALPRAHLDRLQEKRSAHERETRRNVRRTFERLSWSDGVLATWNALARRVPPVPRALLCGGLMWKSLAGARAAASSLDRLRAAQDLQPPARREVITADLALRVADQQCGVTGEEQRRRLKAFQLDQEAAATPVPDDDACSPA